MWWCDPCIHIYCFFVWFGVLVVKIRASNELPWRRTQKMPSESVWRSSQAWLDACQESGLANGHQRGDGETVMVSRLDFPANHHRGDRGMNEVDDVLGDGHHLGDKMPVMASIDYFWIIGLVFDFVFSWGRCLAIVLGYLMKLTN